MRDWYSYILKVAVSIIVLLLIQFVYPIPTGILFGVAFYLGLIALLTDRLLPIGFQGWGRWLTEVAIDWFALLAGSWLIVGLPARIGLLTSVAVAALDLTIHQVIALTFGIRGRRIRS
jgi:hypothetical protein